jgi:hypothetical protein
VSAERRRNELARSCAWCGRVYAGSSGWQPERRANPPTGTHGICATCAVDYRNADRRSPDEPSPAGA